MTARPRRRSEVTLSPKPMARALRVTLFEREVRERLSGPAVEILLGRARILSEGRRAASATSDGFFGSTMLTIDLRGADDVVREPCDEAAAARVAALMAADARVQKRVRQIAAGEVERLAGEPLAARVAEVRVRAEGTMIYLDVDVEAPAPS
jgi:hypothetical protein